MVPDVNAVWEEGEAMAVDARVLAEVGRGVSKLTIPTVWSEIFEYKLVRSPYLKNIF